MFRFVILIWTPASWKHISMYFVQVFSPAHMSRDLFSTANVFLLSGNSYFIITLTVLLREWCKSCTGTPSFSSKSLYVFRECPFTVDHLPPCCSRHWSSFFEIISALRGRLSKPFGHNLADLFNLEKSN